jgi:hypothetical protein
MPPTWMMSGWRTVDLVGREQRLEVVLGVAALAGGEAHGDGAADLCQGAHVLGVGQGSSSQYIPAGSSARAAIDGAAHR